MVGGCLARLNVYMKVMVVNFDTLMFVFTVSQELSSEDLHRVVEACEMVTNISTITAVFILSII